MKFAYKDMRGHMITGDVVNPGDWFGKAWLIGYPLGNFAFHLIIEADSEADAIDVLADSKQWGHTINIDETELRGSRNEENVDRAGNDSHPVDLTNVTMERVVDSRCQYLDPTFTNSEGITRQSAEPLTPEQFSDWQNE